MTTITHKTVCNEACADTQRKNKILLSEGQLEAGQAAIMNGHYKDIHMTGTVGQGDRRNMPPSACPRGADTLAGKLRGEVGG